jgi:hypothetical protein
MAKRNIGARRATAGGLVEWVGARCALPVYVTEPEPVRPEMALWVEAGTGLVVGHGLDASGTGSALVEALRQALERPTPGAARAPARVRIGDEPSATELRAAFGDRFELVVGPTPEVADAFESFLAAMGEGDDNDASYFEEGRVSEAAVALLFRAAAELYRAAPWRHASDSDVLRLDVPTLGVDAACVSILGALGQSEGLVTFPSFVGFERFLSAAESAEPHRGPGSVDLGTDAIVLDFWRATELPARMRREAAERRWPVASTSAYPTVTHRDRDGVLRPLGERDVRIATACAFAVASFVERRPEVFTRHRHESVSETIVTEGEVTARLTFPFDGVEPAAVVKAPAIAATASVPTSKVGRNEPCPCGSGKKFKKCCAVAGDAERVAERRRAHVHEEDEQLVATMMHFAEERLGPKWGDAIDRALEVLGDVPTIVQLVGPWSVYGAAVGGRRVVDCFLEERAKHLTGAQRAWLEAQQRARLGVWEITACEPGVGVTVRDLLSGYGESRRVREVRGSNVLVARDVVLGRIVDLEGASYFCGIHPRLLPPSAGARVAEKCRRRLARRSRASNGEHQSGANDLAMMREWTRAVVEVDTERSAPRKLVNTDGEEVVLTSDHFAFDVKARDEIVSALRTLAGVEPPDDDSDADEPFTFLRDGNAVHKSWENTVIGKAFLRGTNLVVETNSVERADALRRRIEERCGSLVRHRAREHADPLSIAARRAERGAPARPFEAPPPEALGILEELKTKFYEQWVDDRIPALGGKTPRQAVRTKTGRRQVDLLLREMENHERRSAQGPPFDFGRLRAKLALDDAGPA